MDELHDQVRSTNVKYIGTLAYNRRSGKVSNPREHNIAADWVINDGAILRLLSRVLFNEAQAERARRTKRYEPAELLELLRTCHKRHGDVTSQIIDGDPLMQALGNTSPCSDRCLPPMSSLTCPPLLGRASSRSGAYCWLYEKHCSLRSACWRARPAP